MTEETQHSRQRKYTNMLIILAVMIVVSVFSYLHGEAAVQLNWNETQVQITTPDDNSFTILYNDICRTELIDHPNYGTCIQGDKTASWLYGIWENSTWGTYTLCAADGVDLCIVLHTETQVYVLSYESDETTSALYNSILTLIHQQ